MFSIQAGRADNKCHFPRDYCRDREVFVVTPRITTIASNVVRDAVAARVLVSGYESDRGSPGQSDLSSVLVRPMV